jgi:hypothetical protein
MGDNIETLPTTNDPISENEKRVIEYLFQTKLEDLHPPPSCLSPYKKYKLIVFSGICFVVLSLKSTDDFIFSLCGGNKLLSLAIKVFVFVSLLLLVEKFL